MTNRELIEKLKKLPPDYEVWFEADYAVSKRFVSAASSDNEEQIIVIE